MNFQAFGRRSMVLYLAALAGCSDGVDLSGISGNAPVTPLSPQTGAPDNVVFFDDFQDQVAERWDTMEGQWTIEDRGGSLRAFAPQPREFGLAVAGRTGWRDYRVDADVTIQDDRFGLVGLAGHVQWTHHYYELLIGRDPAGNKSWFIRQRMNHKWTTLASGPVEYELDTRYVLRFVLGNSSLEGYLSRDGASFARLGAVPAPADGLVQGRVGLVSYGGRAHFDNVSVKPGDLLFAQAPGWTELTLLRDTSGTFSGAPMGGWYVTPIHATLRPRDGRVLITGFGRKSAANCSGSTQRETGETWLLDPAQLNTAGGTLNVQPINEQNADTTHHVLYCAGHNTLADGRIFFSAGTDYTSSGGLPDSSPELGLRYSRIYNVSNNTITRITANMNGGHSGARGMKWYPTNLLLGDGRVLMFGGFHFSASGPSGVPKPNRSLEIFDPAIWDANHSANPYSVLTQHENGDADTPPTRGYTNLFQLLKPVPAAAAGNLARPVAMLGGVGRVVLYTQEPLPSGAGSRLHRRTNSLTINPSTANEDHAAEKGEGASGVLLADGRLMFANGGHSPSGAAAAYYYNPYTDAWTNQALGITRVYGDAVQLPDGNVLVINGYQGPGEAGNEDDIDGTPQGDVRRPQIINPYMSPPTVDSQTAWPESTHRGYHSVALLLKDGRILVGGGKDASHATGCEKNELRIYSPPNVMGDRPHIETPGDGATMRIGDPSFTITFSGPAPRSVRGVVLMGPGSMTHSFDMGQRYVPLKVLSGPTGNSITVEPPTDTNIAQPTDYTLYLVSSAGIISEGTYVRLLPPQPRVTNLGGSAYIEAECSSMRSGPWQEVADTSRSEAAYLEVTQGSGNHTSNTGIDEGKVSWYNLNVTTAGTYNLWFLTQGPSSDDDSFWISLDGRLDTQLAPTAVWGWRQPATVAHALTAGKHQLRVKVREDGARIDKIFLSTGTTAPTGNGGTAQILCGGPCTAPPAPGPVSATPDNCQATIDWNDVAGESGYEIRRNGSVLGVNIPADQTSFVDQPLAAGSYTYEVRAVQGTCASDWVAAPAISVSCMSSFTTIDREAESFTITAPLTAQSDGNASGQQYIAAPVGTNSTGAVPTTGRATLSFTVPTAGAYKVWGRVSVLNNGQDSYWVAVNGGSFTNWNNIPIGVPYHWDDVHNGAVSGNPVVSFNLNAGSNTLVFAYREGGTRLDRVIITNDPGFVPPP